MSFEDNPADSIYNEYDKEIHDLKAELDLYKSKTPHTAVGFSIRLKELRL